MCQLGRVASVGRWCALAGTGWQENGMTSTGWTTGADDSKADEGLTSGGMNVFTNGSSPVAGSFPRAELSILSPPPTGVV